MFVRTGLLISKCRLSDFKHDYQRLFTFEILSDFHCEMVIANVYCCVPRLTTVAFIKLLSSHP